MAVRRALAVPSQLVRMWAGERCVVELLSIDD
jgi:hypothetical protein